MQFADVAWTFKTQTSIK